MNLQSNKGDGSARRQALFRLWRGNPYEESTRVRNRERTANYMITEAIVTASEYVAGLGLDAVKEHVHEELDEKKLRSELASYIEHQRKYNEMCSLAEEIDFQGLMEYIRNNLIEQVGLRIIDPNRKKRGQARKDIVDSAVAFSKANTPEAKQRVSKCISICLDIIHGFYKTHRFSVKDYLLADMIVDAVAEDVHDATTTTVAAVDSAADRILAKLDDNGSLFSIDKAIALAEAGKVDAVGDCIKKVLDHISLEHPYYPDFGYDYVQGTLRSTPLTPEARRMYPPRVILTGLVKIGDQYISDSNCDPLNYAYRHQLKIMLEVSKAKKLLGEKLDPRQDEVVDLVGSTLIAVPPEFPPAFPCSIKVGNKTFFDYVLLRTQEILDDGVYVVGNREQGGPFYFEVKINPDNPSKPDFKLSMNGANNHELLNYVKFMNTLSKEKDLHIYELSLGEDFIAGHINDINYKTGFSSVDEEIDFLERICEIEDYFGVHLNTEGEISETEYGTVLHISELIRNDQITRTWNEATLTGILDHHFREELINMEGEVHMLSYAGSVHADLFGAEFDFPFITTFKCAYIVDYEKVKRKAEVLDDGDSINITLRAGNDNGTIESLKIPENIERAS